MIRKALVLAGALALQFSIPSDYSVCNIISPGPITPQTPQQPFKRQPDFAALAYPKTDIFDGMPPTRMRGAATMTVKTGSVSDCGPPPPGTVFEACVRGGIVHMPNPCDFPDQSFARLLCHEQAHVAWGGPVEHGG